MKLYTIAINGREQEQHKSFSTKEDAKEYIKSLLTDGSFGYQVLEKTYNSSYQIEGVEAV